MDVSRDSALLGEVKSFHSFNGAIQVPRGWMQCDGNVINQTNYDAIHGSGAYVADGIADLVLAGKYTPNLTDKYLVGASTTTQTGGSAITSVGNSGHSVTDPAHNHIWFKNAGSGTSDDLTYNVSGAETGINTTGPKTSGAISIDAKADSTAHLANSSGGGNYTSNDSGGSIDIQPESIEVMFIIRVGV